MSRKDTLIRAVKRGGKLYREMPDGSEVEMPVPPGRRMTQKEIHLLKRSRHSNRAMQSKAVGQTMWESGGPLD